MKTVTTVTYNHTRLASLEPGDTAVISCAGRKMTTDIVIVFRHAGSITYHGVTTSIASGKVVTLPCERNKMKSDVQITIPLELSEPSYSN